MHETHDVLTVDHTDDRDIGGGCYIVAIMQFELMWPNVEVTLDSRTCSAYKAAAHSISVSVGNAYWMDGSCP